MSMYSDFFLAAPSHEVQYECFQVSHPTFTKTYNVVRNSSMGLQVTHEDGASVWYDYYPVQITSNGARGDLDQGFSISFGDLGTIIPDEMDRLMRSSSFYIKPVITYRTYRSAYLAGPMFGPLILQAQTFSFKKEGATFEVKAPSLNLNQTGEIYSMDRFTGLVGFL